MSTCDTNAQETVCSVCGDFARLPIDDRTELPVDWMVVDITTFRGKINKIVCPAHLTSVMVALGEWGPRLGISHVRR